MSTQLTADAQAKHLEDSRHFIKQQESSMRKCLDARGKLLDAIKHASTLVSELRTSSLSPRQYYELYISCFDALSYLSSHLKEGQKGHHLADVYELVQYAGNIVPRLYLMITVGSAYMSTIDAPVKEIMKDMMEMCRGVQHPVRGLFLRYYLSQVARDYLPTGSSDGIGGNLDDSIQFIITNFIEMNKLWVRMQHQGHSRERDKRTKERQELQVLVGSNLVRLSELEGINKELYRDSILPLILEQVIQCRDIVAQEYLLDVVCQVFPDEFHLHTLDLLLNTANQLNPAVSMKKVILAMVNRLADYYQNDKIYENLGEKMEKTGLQETSTEKNEIDEVAADGETSAGEVRTAPFDLFETIFDHVTKMAELRPDIPEDDIAGIMVGIANLSLNCYPEDRAKIDKILAYQLSRKAKGGEKGNLDLLRVLMEFYTEGPLAVLELENYVSLLKAQPLASQQYISGVTLAAILKEKTPIKTVDQAEGVFDLLDIVIKEGTAQPRTTGLPGGNSFAENGSEAIETAEVLDDQSRLAKIVYLLTNEDPDIVAKLLSLARKSLHNGGSKVRYTFPSIVTASLRLVRKYHKLGEKPKVNSTFKFCHRVIEDFYKSGGNSIGDLTLRLFVDTATVADQVESEEAAFELFAQAFTVYEENIIDSRSQYQALLVIAGALQSTRNFSQDNYDTLVSKCALYGSKLLKRPDQCRAVYLASHLWWTTEIPALGEDESTEGFKDGKRVLECLQRALRAADGCMDVAVTVELFVEILNRYLYFSDRGNGEITIKYINGLIDLIRTNLANNTDESISDSPRKHFERTLEFIRQRQKEDERWSDVNISEVAI